MKAPHFPRTKGQTLLVSIMVICVLMLFAVPILLYFNRYTTRTILITQQREKATTAIQEASTYVTHVFASTATWESAQRGVCPPEFEDSADSKSNFQTAAGTPYRISCELTPQPPPGQFRVRVTAYGSGKESAALRTAVLTLSQRTLARPQLFGVNPIEQAAVLLLKVPAITGELVVHWGPILCYDSALWILKRPFSELTFPRKYSAGLITEEGSSDADRPDIFSKIAMGFVPVINERSYKSSAEISKDVIAPTTQDDNTRVLYANPKNSGYFYMDNTVADFSMLGKTYQVPSPTTVIYVDGNAELQNAFLDISNGGALIVKGNLLLRKRPLSGGQLVQLTVPAKARREYLNHEESVDFPCAKSEDKVCGQDIPVDIKGFVYVQGNLILEEPGSFNTAWTIAGALRVDGQLIIPRSAKLTVYFDDNVANRIRVSGSSVEVISIN